MIRRSWREVFKLFQKGNHVLSFLLLHPILVTTLPEQGYWPGCIMSTLEGVQVGRDRDAAGQGQPRLPSMCERFWFWLALSHGHYPAFKGKGFRRANSNVYGGVRGFPVLLSKALDTSRESNNSTQDWTLSTWREHQIPQGKVSVPHAVHFQAPCPPRHPNAIHKTGLLPVLLSKWGVPRTPSNSGCC